MRHIQGFDSVVPGCKLFFITNEGQVVGTLTHTRIPRKLKKWQNKGCRKRFPKRQTIIIDIDDERFNEPYY